MSKITSFQTFSQLRAQETEAKLAEEKVAKRSELAGRLAAILDEMDITSFDELELEAKREFITKAFGNVSEESEEVAEEPVEEGRAFAAAAKKAKDEGKEEFEFNGKTYPVLIKESEEINEGKRENGKVVTIWKKSGLTDLNTIAKVYADAMEDANFHKEMVTSKAIGAASKGSKLTGKSEELYSDIANAAGWSGYAIANGTVQYLNHIGEEEAASKLLTAITKYNLNESAELPLSLELVNESEKDEQIAMELYTQVAGPDGAYTEDELAKGDDKLFNQIVSAAGHKGSKAKKIVDEFRKIATMESVVSEKKADGTISDDEDERREDLMSQVEVSIDDLLAMIKKEANDIGGSFRSPGIMYDAKKLIEDKLKKFK